MFSSPKLPLHHHATTMASSDSIQIQATEQALRHQFDYAARVNYFVEPRPFQQRVGVAMMKKKNCKKECRMLCIAGTGSGKSILYQTLSAIFRGITIYVSPLLTLGADQGKLRSCASGESIDYVLNFNIKIDKATFTYYE